MTRHTRSFWVGLLEEMSAGRGLAEVARRHRVRERTLQWWQWKLGRAAAGSPRFLPVVAAASTTRAPTHVVVAAGAASIQVEVGTDVTYVAALTRALREGC